MNDTPLKNRKFGEWSEDGKPQDRADSGIRYIYSERLPERKAGDEDSGPTEACSPR